MARRYELRGGTVLILAGSAGLAVAAVLAGCSGAIDQPWEHPLEQIAVVAASSTNTVETSATAAPSAGDTPDSRPVIACFGDSLTAGPGVEPTLNYPADLQLLLDQAGYHYRVVNEGESGDTTKDGLGRIAHVLARKPQIVVLEFGGNDGLRGLPVERTQQYLGAMVEQLQRSGAKVALAGITLPPQYGPQYIAQFDAMYPALAKRYRVPLLPFILKDVYGVEGDIQSDGVHPTAQGAKQVAVNVQKLIEPLLKK